MFVVLFREMHHLNIVYRVKYWDRSGVVRLELHFTEFQRVVESSPRLPLNTDGPVREIASEVESVQV